jgi:hypothetical protein
VKERKQFFFEKKNQKTFVVKTPFSGQNRDSDIKVFCFFSSEKKALPFFAVHTQRTALSPQAWPCR